MGSGWVSWGRVVGHCQLSSGDCANIHNTVNTVTQITEDCTNIPRQAIIHCVSAMFLSLTSFAHIKSSHNRFVLFAQLSLHFLYIDVIHITVNGTAKVHQLQIIFNLIPFGKWCFYNLVRRLHFVSFHCCKTVSNRDLETCLS